MSSTKKKTLIRKLPWRMHPDNSPRYLRWVESFRDDLRHQCKEGDKVVLPVGDKFTIRQLKDKEGKNTRQFQLTLEYVLREPPQEFRFTTQAILPAVG